MDAGSRITSGTVIETTINPAPKTHACKWTSWHHEPPWSFFIYPVKQ